MWQIKPNQRMSTTMCSLARIKMKHTPSTDIFIPLFGIKFILKPHFFQLYVPHVNIAFLLYFSPPTSPHDQSFRIAVCCSICLLFVKAMDSTRNYTNTPHLSITKKHSHPLSNMLRPFLKLKAHLGNTTSS